MEDYLKRESLLRRYRGEHASDLKSLLEKHGISEEETIKQAGGDPRVLLYGVPIVTAKIPAGQGSGYHDLHTVSSIR